MKQKESPQAVIRWNEQDRKLIAALRKKLGLQTVSELVRQALRALATKEGVAI